MPASNMRSIKSYLTSLFLFGTFIVISTQQLGKSRTTINVLEKQKSKASSRMPIPKNKLAIQFVPNTPVPNHLPEPSDSLLQVD